jgi:glycogen operon protein
MPPPAPEQITTQAGAPLPFGVTVMANAINFSLFCRQAISITLCLFKPGESKSSISVPLEQPRHRTGDIWHIEVRGIDPGWGYAYQVAVREAGPNQEQLLLDPYAKRIDGGECWGEVVSGRWRCGIVADAFPWEGDRPLNRPMEDTIIYELHVRGFTRHASAKVKHQGTFLGIIEKIPYLQELGITALELLPTAEFDENENKAIDPVTGKPLKNFWGYSPLAYFAPKASFASVPGQQVNEFKTMVRALHRAGIEVILDVVFNHTAEGNRHGPTISFKGLGNEIYYLLEDEKDDYHNFSGCGNTLNCNHPVVREFIIDCLRYWVLEMHVDGFRFDLASIMTRGLMGEVLGQPPLVEQIAEDPVLARTKIIAEAWDATGLYQVGHFSANPRWAEWNGRFRDDCRAFLAGHGGKISTFATRIAGSSDLYQHNRRRPTNSINFLTSHDGFTLWDLVTYNHKHNEQNGEHNRDGDNHNLSWNSGKEGGSRAIKVLTLRARRLRTLAVVLFLSQGTPMLVAGDEFCRTQRGNNNAYCQDNAISWLDWRLTQKNADTLRFFQMLIRLRRRYRSFRRSEFFTPPSSTLPPEIIWQGPTLGLEDWSNECKLLCFTLVGSAAGQEPDFFVIINGSHQECFVEIPAPRNGGRWRQVIHTALPSPQDIVAEERGALLKGSTMHVPTMAAVVLIAKRPKSP